MTDRAQRAEWAEHLRDEAGAIARQQVTAGGTHTPVEGPLPHSLDDTGAAAQAAASAERAHCAALAAGFASPAKLLQLFPDATQQQRECAAALALQIAQAIRTRGD